MVNIGGFFASLKMQSDAASFDQSLKLINSVDSSLLRAHKTFGSFVADTVKGFVAIGGAALGASSVISNMQAKQLVSARVANLSTEAFQNWAGAMKLLNVNSEDFISGASGLQKTFDNIVSNPEAYNSLAKNLALIGVDIAKLQSMSNNDRLFAILGAVEKLQGEKFRFGANIVGEILGNSAREALFSARTLGTSVVNQYSVSEGQRFVTTQSQTDAAKNTYSINKLGNQADQVFSSALTALGTELRPLFDDLTKWLKTNGPEIIAGFRTLGSAIMGLIEALKPFAKFITDTVGGAIKGVTQGNIATEFITSAKGKATAAAISGQLMSRKDLSDAERRTLTDETLKVIANGIQSYSEYPKSDLDKIPKSISINGVTVNMTPDAAKAAAGILHSEWGNLPTGFGTKDWGEYAAIIALLAMTNARK